MLLVAVLQSCRSSRRINRLIERGTDRSSSSSSSHPRRPSSSASQTSQAFSASHGGARDQEARHTAGVGSQPALLLQQLQGNDDDPIVIPWDEIREELGELLRLLASALAGVREWAAAGALAVFCCGYYAAVGRHGPRGPDGPVVRYRGGIFSLHPNRPFVS